MHTDSEALAGAGIAGSSARMIAGESALSHLAGARHGPETLYGGVSAIELGIHRLMTLARRAGATGAKGCGAGGGGCVFFLLARAGGEILRVQVAARGVTIRKGRGI
jgi:hypothetical protein